MGDREEGVKVGGKLLKDIRFADDQAVVASTEKGLQYLMDDIVKTAKKYDMKLNVKKTKVMRISKRNIGTVDITVEGQKMEQVKSFKYLGSIITDDGRCEAEIKARIATAKEAFSKRKVLLTKKLSKRVKKRIIKTIIWSIALYSSESWTLRVDEEKRLQAFEMWLWRRMERISYKDKKTNEEVLEMVGGKLSILQLVVKRKKNWLGHILRADGILKEMIEGRMEGRRSRGRPRIGMLDVLKEGSYERMKRRAEDRVAWRSWVPKTCRMAEH